MYDDISDPALIELKSFVQQHPKALEHEPLWYWAALSSFSVSQLGPGEDRFQTVTDDVYKRIALLFNDEATEPSEAAKLLVAKFQLAPYVEPADLERQLQVWIFNCFDLGTISGTGASAKPQGYAILFVPSFMSHS